MKQVVLPILVLLALGAGAAEPTDSSAAAKQTETTQAAQSEAAAVKNTATDNPTEPRARRPARGTTDRIELETTQVSGNRELPKIMYVVPWKKAELGDLPGQPFNTLLDEVLMPLDRDVFRREVTYYDTVTGGARAAEPSPKDPTAQ